MKELYNLWYKGVRLTRTAPYSGLSAVDMSTSVWRIRLSKAKEVMKVLTAEAIKLGLITRGRDLYSKSYSDFDKIYESSFVSRAKCITGETDEIGLDRRGVGNIGYLRFYDLIKEPTRKKRNRAFIDNTSLDS